MWDGLFMLLVLSTIMAIASFLAGSLPLTLKLSQRKLRLISAVGTGVLVGTSLIVIIPEGIETLYSARSAAAPQNPISAKDRIASIAVRRSSSIHNVAKLASISQREEVASGFAVEERGAQPELVVWQTKRDPVDTPGGQTEHKHDDSHESSPHAWIGLSLIAGYILMYLIDTLPALAKPLSQPRALHISLSELSQGLHHSPSSVPGSPSLHATASGAYHTPSTTIGLVIHAIADGIALGASTASATARASLGLVVFLAIMLHKAPAAFGLTSVLLKQGLSRRQARAHLLVFSLAAPVGAFATWALVNVLGQGGVAEGETELWWTGIVLVFSGGTFLYVAMHSMQDAQQHGGVDGIDGNGYLDESPYRMQQSSDKGIETGAAVIGMLLPLITQVGHAH